MSRVEKTNEKRAEQRLRYRWPVRFAVRTGQKPCSGQAVDITSRSIAFLYHPGEHCPRPNQLVTANFGVPHFNAHGSFDTVFFNRTGRVCRVDSLSEKVSRVAVQFAEPLFFKPGEQDISDSDAQLRLQARARSAIEARQKAGIDKSASVKAKRKVAAQIQRRVKTEKKAAKKVQVCVEKIAEVQAEAAEAITSVAAETSTGNRASNPNVPKESSEQGAGQAISRRLLKKVDSFITDKNKVF